MKAKQWIFAFKCLIPLNQLQKNIMFILIVLEINLFSIFLGLH